MKSTKKILVAALSIFILAGIAHADTLQGAATAFTSPDGPPLGNNYSPAVTYDDQDQDFKMWYGEQGTDGHDHILYRVSNDGVNWSGPSVIYTYIDFANQTGDSPQNVVHVNDPSVVKFLNPASNQYQYTMFLTVCGRSGNPCTGAPSGNDVWSLVSADGINWVAPVLLAPNLPSGYAQPTAPSVILDSSGPSQTAYHVYYGADYTPQGSPFSPIFASYVDGNRHPIGDPVAVTNSGYDRTMAYTNPEVAQIGGQ